MLAEKHGPFSEGSSNHTLTLLAAKGHIAPHFDTTSSHVTCTINKDTCPQKNRSENVQARLPQITQLETHIHLIFGLTLV